MTFSARHPVPSDSCSLRAADHRLPVKLTAKREETAMRPYHPANLKHQPYAPWRVIALAWAGKLFGIQFKIDGIPYGAPYNAALWPENRSENGAAASPVYRVDRDGNCMKPERKVVLRARDA